jgi:hypothetical protein
VSTLFSRMTGTRCANCGMHSPQIRKQGTTKLFAVWTSKKALKENMQLAGSDGGTGSVLERKTGEQVSVWARVGQRWVRFGFLYASKAL